MENAQSDEKENGEKPDHPFTQLRGSDIRGDNSIFYNIPGEPSMVVRKSFVNVSDGEAEEMDIHEKAEYLRNKAVEFKKIIDRLGIRTAKTDYIIGTDPEKDRPAIFGVTERIDGENLEETPFLDRETAEKVDDLYAKIIIESIDSYLKNGPYWHDPKNAQFVFGKAQGDEKPDIYLVDVDPNVHTWDEWEKLKEPQEFSTKPESIFWDHMKWILMEMEDLENKVDEKNFKLVKAREALERAKTAVPGAAEKGIK
jgi:hypothetical protein